MPKSRAERYESRNADCPVCLSPDVRSLNPEFCRQCNAKWCHDCHNRMATSSRSCPLCRNPFNEEQLENAGVFQLNTSLPEYRTGFSLGYYNTFDMNYNIPQSQEDPRLGDIDITVPQDYNTLTIFQKGAVDGRRYALQDIDSGQIPQHSRHLFGKRKKLSELNYLKKFI